MDSLPESFLHLSKSFDSGRKSVFGSIAETPIANQNQTYVEIENVRITPKKMIFWSAFDGKMFREQITIQNCGKKTATIQYGSIKSFVSTSYLLLPPSPDHRSIELSGV